ncbi:MAG: response regulator [Chitinophagales bacterium]
MKTELLLIDDDDIFIFMSKKMIEKTGFHTAPLVFKNGSLALDYLKEAYNKDTSYILFLDINMPVMNGWEFLDELEEVAVPENTFVFMLTSSIAEFDKKKAETNPFVMKFLSKPVLTSTFEEIKHMSGIRKLFL